MSPQTDTPGPARPVSIDPDEVADGVARDIIAIGYGTIEVLELFQATDDLASLGYEPHHIERFEAAFRAFDRLRTRHDLEVIARDGTDAIDDDVLEAIEATFPPIAGVFVEDFALGSPDPEGPLARLRDKLDRWR